MNDVTDTKRDAMLDRVRKLLAKAEASGVTEAEAEMLTAKATELMARYGIDKALAAARANVKVTPTDKVFTATAPYAGEKGRLIHAVARALHCKAVSIENGQTARVHVFGFESDVEMVEMLYTSLLLQMSHEVARMDIPPWITGRSKMAERRSFMFGYINAVEPRLTEAFKLAEVQADTTGTPGTELVLASRDVAVMKARDAFYPRLVKQRTTYRGGSAGAGAAAGRRANIHNRPNVSGGSRALAR